MSDLETKFTRIYETDECISIWKYDTKFSKTNPISVEHKWKKSFDPWKNPKKTLGDIVKSEKTQKRKSNSAKTP